MTSLPYQHLGLLEREIRLAVLAPDRDFRARPSCTLKIASLDLQPTYEAISYVWGEGDVLMELEGMEWGITPNLHACLRHLRDEVEERTLWIDAICINQSCIEERNEQVLLMKTIYENASRVNAWLGPGSEETDKAMAMIAAITSSQNLSKATLHGAPLKASDLLCLKSFTASTWWERVWVVQEVCLPMQVYFYYGHNSISMAVLRTFTTLWHHIMGTWSTETKLLFSEENLDMDSTDFLWANPLSFLMNLTKYGTQRRLERMERTVDVPDILEDLQWPPPRRQELAEGELITKILATCRNRKTSDPRDKIYGLLGLLPQRFVSIIRPDYEMSPGEVFTNFATTMITYAKSLTFLNQATYNRDRGLPSWVPDWEVSWEAAGYDGDRLDYHKFYDAGGDFDIKDVGLDMPLLDLQGVFIDAVSNVGMYSATGHELHREAPSDPLSLYKSCMNEWRSMCGAKTFKWSSRSRYIAGGTLYDAYWNTLFAGVICDGNGPSRECRTSDRKEYMKWRVWQVLGGDIPKVANDSIMSASTGRRLLVCQKGYIGLGPSHTEAGDGVYVIKGSPVPFVLRPVRDVDQSHTFKIIGECYVHGIMNGEAVQKDSQDQKMSMSEWLRLKVFGGTGPDPANGRRFFDWISIE